jgi:hypothetical protein
VAQRSNLVNDPTDPIGEPLVQHVEIQRLGIAMGKMLGASILAVLSVFGHRHRKHSHERNAGFAIHPRVFRSFR